MARRRKIDGLFALGPLVIRPPKVRTTTEGETVRTESYCLELVLEHEGRADVLTSFLGSVSADVCACTIKSVATGEEWEGHVRIVRSSIRSGDEHPIVRVKLSVESESPTAELLPLIALRIDHDEQHPGELVSVKLAPTQESLPFAESGDGEAA